MITLQEREERTERAIRAVNKIAHHSTILLFNLDEILKNSRVAKAAQDLGQSDDVRELMGIIDANTTKAESALGELCGEIQIIKILLGRDLR